MDIKTPGSMEVNITVAKGSIIEMTITETEVSQKTEVTLEIAIKVVVSIISLKMITGVGIIPVSVHSMGMIELDQEKGKHTTMTRKIGTTGHQVGALIVIVAIRVERQKCMLHLSRRIKAVLEDQEIKHQGQVRVEEVVQSHL